MAVMREGKVVILAVRCPSSKHAAWLEANIEDLVDRAVSDACPDGELPEETQSRESLGIDAIMNAVNSLPETVRAGVLAQLREIAGDPEHTSG
jgi:hypothetical protein